MRAIQGNAQQATQPEKAMFSTLKSINGNQRQTGEIEFPYLAKVGVVGSNPIARSNAQIVQPPRSLDIDARLGRPDD
ncbi:MAG TPA: hypothetical protein VNZ53_37855 [Steroidobacteraceae bacterium]|nr:hypothetical protein [Steroidobacteraceae bacterium]